MVLKIGTRGSRLALTQTKWVAEQLKQKYTDLEIELKIIKTKGDKIKDVALDKIGDKGLFVKELEQALIHGEIDLAVHSMKDMPSQLPEGLMLTKSPIREDARDVLVTPHNIKNVRELPKDSVIGTGSKRRHYQLSKIRDDLQVVSIRGNIDTRIKKMLQNNMDGIILAYAGLKRLGIDRSSAYNVIPFYIREMIPAPCQGILAIEVREKDIDTINIVESIADKETNIHSKLERDFLMKMEGSCHIPVGAYTVIDKKEISLTGLYGLEDGSLLVKKTKDAPLGEHENLGIDVAISLKKEMKNCQE